MIFVESKKKSRKTLEKLYPQAEIIDLTSKGIEPYVQFSPFYPHGNIPVPFTSLTSYSVEGIWQGLKVFQEYDIDRSKFEIQNMKGLKRTVRKFGKPLGHRQGVDGGLLDYLTARRLIYMKSYAWVLDHKLSVLIEDLRGKAEKTDLVFLDFETNGEIENISKPLSHAALVKKYLEKKYPSIGSVRFSFPQVDEKPKKERKTKSPRKKKGIVEQERINFDSGDIKI